MKFAQNFMPFVVVVALLTTARPVWSQCAMCKEAIETDADTNSSGTAGTAALTGYARGIYLSIMFLLTMLFSLAGGVVFLIVREGRQPPPSADFLLAVPPAPPSTPSS